MYQRNTSLQPEISNFVSIDQPPQRPGLICLDSNNLVDFQTDQSVLEPKCYYVQPFECLNDQRSDDIFGSHQNQNCHASLAASSNHNTPDLLSIGSVSSCPSSTNSSSSTSTLNVEFAALSSSSCSLFNKDAEKASKAIKVTKLPNLKHPILYVEKGRVIDVTVETNSCISKSVLQFDIYTLKGTIEEPVYGTSDISELKKTYGSNMCFIQAAEEEKVSAIYTRSPDGFLSMIVPFKYNPYSLSVRFPFLNFKCNSSSKKVVYLKISLFNGLEYLTSKIFQLVSCTSPNRDFKRHFDKLSSGSPSTPGSPTKKTKKCSSEQTESMAPQNTESPQYVIMTENYDIWKILNIIHQQLIQHFKSKN